MSNYTLSRLPDHILHIFKIYERASNNALPYKNTRIKNYLQRTTPEYYNFQRNKLLTVDYEKGKFNPNDFPPIISTLIKPIFEGPLELGDWRICEPKISSNNTRIRRALEKQRII